MNEGKWCIIDRAPDARRLEAYESASRHVDLEVIFPCAKTGGDGQFTWERLPCTGIHLGHLVHGFAPLKQALLWSANRWVLVQPEPFWAVRATMLAARRRATLIFWLAGDIKMAHQFCKMARRLKVCVDAYTLDDGLRWLAAQSQRGRETA